MQSQRLALSLSVPYAGFVRFAQPESVQRALKKYREFEIEIQDVSVSIKTLKSERPR
jgi:hypothetical protein